MDRALQASSPSENAMSVTVTLSDVSACDATNCTYNTNRRCHAPAITIGDDALPVCVTFLPDEQHFTPRPLAGVGACKISACVYNRDRSCHAGAIDVTLKESSPICITFTPRARAGK
jgi:hypothetical protein